jgi:hypothetical protein
VWQELQASGSRVFNEDVLAVACETMLRAGRNIDAVIKSCSEKVYTSAEKFLIEEISL